MTSPGSKPKWIQTKLIDNVYKPFCKGTSVNKTEQVLNNLIPSIVYKQLAISTSNHNIIISKTMI